MEFDVGKLLANAYSRTVYRMAQIVVAAFITQFGPLYNLGVNVRLRLKSVISITIRTL